jgi:hypothetical protein
VSTTDSPFPFARTARETLPSLRAALTERLSVDSSALLAPVRATAFWSAALLPPVYLPLLLRGVSAENLPVILGLLALNALLFVVGHEHNESNES